MMQQTLTALIGEEFKLGLELNKLKHLLPTHGKNNDPTLTCTRKITDLKININFLHMMLGL